jgi:hypothetical protein
MRMFILLATALLAPSCTDQPVNTGTNAAANGTRECFFSSQVSGFKDDGQDRVLVRIGFREGYALTLAAGCPPVNLATSIGIVARGGGRICTGRPAELVVPRASGTGSQRCLVSDVRKLSETELATGWGRQPAD